MKITYNNDKDSGHVAEILPFDNRHSSISVFRKRDRHTGKWVSVGINWSACGSVSVEDTRLFINALQEAVKIAEDERALWEQPQ